MQRNVVLIGSDLNVYYMARCCHEKYGEPVDVIATEPIRFTQYSKIVNIEYHSDLKTTEGFVKALKAYGEAHIRQGKSLLVPCHDVYVRLLAENREELEPYYLFNCPSYVIVDSFLKKEKFYRDYADSGLDFARTLFYDCSKAETEPLPKDIVYPLIIKPSDGIEYGRHHFEGQPKVFKATTPDNAVAFIDKVKASGYRDTLIVQEFIPDDDTCLFDAVFYCNKHGRAELGTFAQIGLQEHGPTALGNATVLINGFNEYGHTGETVEQLKTFLEKIHYTGFAEFDLKYDSRTKTFKVLEINPRQARSSYYLAALGHNLIGYLIEDLFDDIQRDFVLLDKEILLSMVPKRVIRKYIFNEDYKKEALSLWRHRQKVDPLRYGKEKSLKHRIYLILRAFNYSKKYRMNKNTI